MVDVSDVDVFRARARLTKSNRALPIVDGLCLSSRCTLHVDLDVHERQPHGQPAFA